MSEAHTLDGDPGALGHIEHPRSRFPVAADARLPKPSNPRRVVVIGAGLAGLVAGYELTKCGHDVTILEARARPGGRVLTIREPFTDGLYAEAGALFIPGHHNLTIGYARAFGLSLRQLPKARAVFYMAGTRIVDANDPLAPWPVTLWEKEQRAGAGGMWADYVLPVLQDIGDPRASGWPPPGVARLGDDTTYDFLRSRGASPGAIDILGISLMSSWGDGVRWNAALALLRDSALTMGGFPKEMTFRASASGSGMEDPVLRDEAAVADEGTLAAASAVYRIGGGNDQLPRAFADSPVLEGRIRYETPVSAIRGGDGPLTVVCEGPGGVDEVAGERVICTIPFSVLRTIDLSLPLSAAKRRAIDRLEYTSVTRVFVESRTRYWEPARIPPNAFTDLPVMMIIDQSAALAGTRGLLGSYATGEQARVMASLAPAEREQRAIGCIGEVFPESAGQLAGRTSIAWDDERWSRGGYPWFLPGDMSVLMPYIAEPAGSLYFAGDHASALPGWMQGALESGLRAARAVNAS